MAISDPNDINYRKINLGSLVRIRKITHNPSHPRGYDVTWLTGTVISMGKEGIPAEKNRFIKIQGGEKILTKPLFGVYDAAGHSVGCDCEPCSHSDPRMHPVWVSEGV